MVIFILKSISFLYVCVLSCFRYILFGWLWFGFILYVVNVFYWLWFFFPFASYVVVVYLIRFCCFYLFIFPLLSVSQTCSILFSATLLHRYGSAFTVTRILHITFILHNIQTHTSTSAESLSRLTEKHTTCTVCTPIRPVLSSEAPFRVTISPNNTHSVCQHSPQSLAVIIFFRSLSHDVLVSFSVFFLSFSSQTRITCARKVDNWLEKATVHLCVWWCFFFSFHVTTPYTVTTIAPDC